MCALLAILDWRVTLGNNGSQSSRDCFAERVIVTPASVRPCPGVDNQTRDGRSPLAFQEFYWIYLRSRPDEGTGVLIRKRDNASPRFWMNCSDWKTSASGRKLAGGAKG